MADYFSLVFVVFMINLIPAFMPPTWIILSTAMINDPTFNPFILALVGAISSTFGRAGLSFISFAFRRFFSSELLMRAREIKNFFEKKGNALFFGTFIYALSPLPSNLIFIAKGITEVDWKPVFSGFFFGRLVSYYTLIVLSNDIYALLTNYASGDIIRYLFDVLGIIAALLILLIDWKKLTTGKNGNK
ncbi:MAG: hypothetical protein AB1391_04540 [Candidatus Micrarchaeota archaeon]